MLMAFAWKTAAATLMMGCHMGGMGGMGSTAAMTASSTSGLQAAQPAATQAASDDHTDMHHADGEHHACDESMDGDAAKGHGHCRPCAPCSLGVMVSADHVTHATAKPHPPRVAAQGCADLSAVLLAFDRPPKRSA